MNKKHILLFLFILSVIILFWAHIILTFIFYPSVKDLRENYFLGAHRGESSKQFIENTLPAFENSLNDSRYSFIEFDIQYTKDKKLVVYHDLSLLRLDKKLININDLTYDELLNLSSYHIPSYQEVMDLVAGKKPLNIEIKSQGNFADDEEIIDYLIADLKNRSILNTTLVSSVSFDVVRKINEKYNNLSEYASKYYAFWENPRYVDTGIIFFVDESSFTQGIPVIENLFKSFREKGLWGSMIKKMWLSGANYLMIHESNLDQYSKMKSELPFNSKVIFWSLKGDLYLVVPSNDSWKQEGEKLNLPTVPWWQD